MSTTPNLLISHIATSQNNKEVTANTAFDDLDLAMTNIITEALTGTTFTLPTTPDALQNMVFHFTGTLTGTCVVTLPANKKLYIVSNQTNYPLVFQSPAPGRTVQVQDSQVASMPRLEYVILYCDGTNVDAIAGTGISPQDQPNLVDSLLNANLGSTPLLTAAQAGVYRISAYVIVAVPDGASSTLPSVVLSWPDRDNGATQTLALTPTNTGNLKTTLQQAVGVISVEAGTTISISTTGYASGTPGAMVYALHVRTEAL